ncbi:MAG: hypothetical protein KC503_28050, partial [Myxococcales bacterium]|nr:hypothetical protein [Myxococcales bacterium]
APAATPAAPPATTTATRAAPTSKPASKTAGVRATTLGAERRVLDQARAALAARRPASALTLLRAHRRRFARPALAEEREALFVLALVDLGQGSQARARAATFRRRYPRSLLWRAIERALAKVSK